MLQMVMSHGKDDEEIMELVDVPELVLMQFCDVTLRHRDIRNPETHNSLTDITTALKTKAEKESNAPGNFNRYELKEYIKQMEGILQQYPPYDNVASEALAQ